LKILTAIPLLLLPSLYIDLALAENNPNELSKHLSTIVVPQPILRIEPEYPMSAARSSREGWAVFSFVINEEGGVEDVLVKETSGSKDLTKSAKRAIESWRYKPAMSGGKAIKQCVNTVQMDFRMEGDSTQGVSRNFKRRYKRAIAALEAKNYTELDELLTKLNKNKSMHLSEYNFLQILMADYAKALGNKEKQLQHLNRVAMALSPLSDEKHKVSILYRTFVLQVELNQFQAAYRTYEKLIKQPAAEPYLAEFDEIIEKVDNMIASDKDLVIAATIKNDFWSADLVRNEFSLLNVQGSLHTLDVRCANKRHVYTIKENSTWTMPSAWEDCSIYVYGEPNTQFNLIEHPLKS
jgi:TonB family protein